MMRSRIQSLCIVALAVMPTLVEAQSPKIDLGIFNGLKYRQIGPFRGGRSVAVSGVYDQPNHFYMGTTGGGLYKTTDAGENWFPVSDGYFETGVIGAIGVAPSNGNIVYVGTGETPLRGNITQGDGLYKSTDGGKTWARAGLEKTQVIGRILVHPKNPDTVWAAALGPVWGPSPERGIFKSTDGGKSWRKTLFVSDRAGALDVDFDPNNPNFMVATTWEAWRTPFMLNSGGPGSKIFTSKDGGESWTDITGNPGLPKGVLGKIGITISPANPKRLYSIIEAQEGGIYKSDDAGATWVRTSENANLRQRPWYYNRINADPKNENTVYVSNVGFFKSTDGGTNWRGMGTPHSDNHDLWIDPNDPRRMINANDGGANVTVDGGQNWTDQDYATAQIYHVSTDNAFPYNILGAQQDNSTIRIPSRTRGGGITADDWTSTAGGESGYVVAKPDDPDIVFGGSYGGELGWQNHRTGLYRDISPWPDNPMGHGAADLTHRFQWTFPIVFSPHNPNVLYTGSQYVLKSTDMGESWTKISPDLTRNDKTRQGPSGGPITKDNTSVEYYCTVFAIAESPKRAGVIWSGSDDGLVQVTQDGGRTWTNVTPKDAPDWCLVSLIEASPVNPATAFVAINNYKNNDFKPYIYRTDDYGKTWTKIVNGIGGTFVRAVRQDPVNPDLLFAGTENGVFVSFDRGVNWQDLRLNLPKVPVHDLVIKEGDLVLATHGRSFYVLDDITPLRQAAQAALKGGSFLFEPRPAYRVRWGSSGAQSATSTVGGNPQSGALINFFAAKPASKVEISVTDSAGRAVNVGQAPRIEQGFNRIALWPTYSSYKSIPGGVFWGAFPSPILAPAGEYTVKLTLDGETFVTKFRWLCDPRTKASEADSQEQFNFTMKIVARVTEANEAVLKIRAIKTEIDARVSQNDSLKADGDALKSKLSAVEDEVHQGKSRSGQDPLNFPIRLNNRLAALIGTVQGGERRPTKQSYDVFADLTKQLQVQLDSLKSTLDKDLASFNQKLKAAGLAEIKG